MAARQAHNLEVLGSSPSPATKEDDPIVWVVFSDLNAGVMSRDAGERARPRGGGQTKFSEENFSRGQVRVPQQKKPTSPKLVLIFRIIMSVGAVRTKKLFFDRSDCSSQIPYVIRQSGISCRAFMDHFFFKSILPVFANRQG